MGKSINLAVLLNQKPRLRLLNLKQQKIQFNYPFQSSRRSRSVPEGRGTGRLLSGHLRSVATDKPAFSSDVLTCPASFK